MTSVSWGMYYVVQKELGFPQFIPGRQLEQAHY